MNLITEHLNTRAPVTQDPEDQDQLDGVRVAHYAHWRAFAGGQQWPGQPRPGEVRVTLNYARALLRKTASYVFPGAVTFAIDQPGTTDNPDNAATERALATVVQSLDLAALDLELEIERSTIGDAAIKVTWDQEAQSVRVVSVDPATLSVRWSPDNPRAAHQVSQTYQLPGWALLAYGIDVLDDTGTFTVTETWTTTKWSFIVAGSYEREEPNPYGWIPYVVIPNDPHPRRFWGRSDLIDLEPVAVELNQRMSTLSQILQISGSPVAVLENIDGSDGIAVTPGAKWELPEGAKAYLLDLLAGQGTRLHVDYIDQVRTTLHDLSETPRTAFGDTGRPLSGAALEVEIQPLVQRVMRKRQGWDRFYRERNRRILDLIDRFGTAPVGAYRISTPNWPAVLPSDDDAAVARQVALVSANIRSRQEAASTLGDIDPEAGWMQILEELAALNTHDTTKDPNEEVPTLTEPPTAS